MRTVGYRLRWQSGVTLEPMTYGSASYGAGTYGQQGTALNGLKFALIPWTAGQPTSPSWIYRAGDTEPDFRARILSDGELIDVTSVSSILIVLTPIDGRGRDAELEFAGALIPSMLGGITRVWQPGDLDQCGTYRPLVRFGFAASGRDLTVTADDRHTFAILDERRRT